MEATGLSYRLFKSSIKNCLLNLLLHHQCSFIWIEACNTSVCLWCMFVYMCMWGVYVYCVCVCHGPILFPPIWYCVLRGDSLTVSPSGRSEIIPWPWSGSYGSEGFNPPGRLRGWSKGRNEEPTGKAHVHFMRPEPSAENLEFLRPSQDVMGSIGSYPNSAEEYLGGGLGFDAKGSPFLQDILPGLPFGGCLLVPLVTVSNDWSCSAVVFRWPELYFGFIFLS